MTSHQIFICIKLLLMVTISQGTRGDLAIRPLTIKEVTSDQILDIEALVGRRKGPSSRHMSSPVLDQILDIEALVGRRGKEPSSRQKSSPMPDITFLARGTNMEKDVKDAVRMPGTLWCGKGWRTDVHQKMGGYVGADRCCRHHDLGCPLSIEPGQTQWGLNNNRYHTVMHCSCDERFRSCLKMASTQAADLVGNIFFNIAKTKCFVFDKRNTCTAQNWWGMCTKREIVKTAVWRTINY